MRSGRGGEEEADGWKKGVSLKEPQQGTINIQFSPTHGPHTHKCTLVWPYPVVCVHTQSSVQHILRAHALPLMGSVCAGPCPGTANIHVCGLIGVIRTFREQKNTHVYVHTIVRRYTYGLEYSHTHAHT